MTIEEFARQIGVSASTVSRTLSGRGRISPATRQMVFERMRELGYTPNITAQRLVTGRTYTVLLDCGEIPPLADLFTLELIRGVQRALARHHYALQINAPDTDPLRTVRGGAVDGAILVGDEDLEGHPILDTAAMGAQVTSHGVPCVFICHVPAAVRPRVGSVVIGLGSGAREAARALVAEGHQRIAFISSRAGDLVCAAFQEEMERLGGVMPFFQTLIAGRTAEDGERAMRTLLSQPLPPTAVFARTDTLAAGALRAAHRMGVRIPQDISLIGHDDMPFATLLEPPLTTVRVDVDRLGESAADLLLEMMENPDVPPASRTVNTMLVRRETLAAPGSAGV